MNISPEQYKNLSQKTGKNSPLIKNFFLAFVTGGIICLIGQFINDVFSMLGCTEKQTAIITPVILVLLASLLTGLGLYDKIARFAGAGTLVPITGFSNAVTSCAIEYKTEGFIFGVGAKMFTIAGPVIAYGVYASVIYGIIIYIISLF